MAKKRFCMNCGAEIPDGMKLCPVCGTPVEDLEDEEEEPVSIKKNHRNMDINGYGLL